MSIMVMWASPNQSGLTAAAKDQLISGIRAAGREAEELHLNRIKLESCRACGDGWGICKTKGECVIQDDFSSAYDALRRARGIIWVTPVYWHDIAENLKCFWDRLRRCETKFNHFLAEKPCLTVACAGGSGLGAVRCLENMEKTLGHMGMVPVDRLPVIQFNRQYILPALHGAGEAFAAYLSKQAEG